MNEDATLDELRFRAQMYRGVDNTQLPEILAAIHEYKRRMSLWVADLRSGEYTRGEGKLAIVNNGQFEYCCLGVACERAKREGIYLLVEETDRPVPYLTYNGSHNFMPPGVRKWMGMNDTNGRLFFPADLRPDADGFNPNPSLAALNDAGFTFPQIADVIEWHWGLHKADSEESER